MSKAYEEARARFLTRQERKKTEAFLASIEGLGFAGFAENSSLPALQAVFVPLRRRNIPPRSVIGLDRPEADTVGWLCQQLDDVGIGPDCLLHLPGEVAGVPWARVQPTRSAWGTVVRSLKGGNLFVLGLQPEPRILCVRSEEYYRHAVLLQPTPEDGSWSLSGRGPTGRASLATALVRFNETRDVRLLRTLIRDAAEYGAGRESCDWYVAVVRSSQTVEDILAQSSDGERGLTVEQAEAIEQEVARLRALGPRDSRQP
jgi:hypothetical protein